MKKRDTNVADSDRNGDSDIGDFLNELPDGMSETVCRGLDAAQHPMAYVSEQLRILQQTQSCGKLLLDERFYSVEGILPDAVCESLRECIAKHVEQTLPVVLGGIAWELRIIPVGAGALLIFSAAENKPVGITMASAKIRDSVQSLLLQAMLLDMKQMPEEAAVLRQQGYRILRQINHMQLLAGTPEPLCRTSCSAHRLLDRLREQMEKRKVSARVQLPQRDILFDADEGLLSAALMTLVSNSLRSGTDVTVHLTAQQRGESISFCVRDNAGGMDAAALQRMHDTWRSADTADLSGWGLGIPYAERIAALHGGMLLFVPTKDGETEAHFRIPLHTDEFVESSMPYQTDSGLSAADIELSDALQADAYRTER